jgi:ribonuclease G
LPLFDTYRIEDEVQHLEDTRVWLKSGGSLVFSRTEALVTVDVNTSRNTKDRDQISSALRTNLEAVEALVCQLQARDLAGLVVVDFVNAREGDWRKRVDLALGQALRLDAAKTEALPINKFGVAMLTRQREADEAPDRLHELCGCCGGRGRVRSLERVALAVLVQLRRQVPGLAGECLKVRAGKELAAYLEAHRARFLSPLAEKYGIEIQLERAAMSQRAFEIELV